MAHSDRKSRNTASVTLAGENAAQSVRLLSLIPGLPMNRDPMGVNERAELAKEIHDARRSRDRYFPAEVFAEPAWDILLILYWAHHVQQPMTVTNVCASAAVPPTTAIRWIESLQGLGLVRKCQHPTDRRVHWLDLTADATAKLDRYLDDLLDGGTSPHITRARGAKGDLTRA